MESVNLEITCELHLTWIQVKDSFTAEDWLRLYEPMYATSSIRTE